MDFLATIKAQVETRLREQQEGRERQDAGERVAGSRKEKAAIRKLLLTPDELMSAEATPGAASMLVRKVQAFPRPDFEGLRAAGHISAPVAAYIFLIWKTFPDEPKIDTPFARMAYTRLARDLNTFVQQVIDWGNNDDPKRPFYKGGNGIFNIAADFKRDVICFDENVEKRVGESVGDYKFHLSELDTYQKYQVQAILAMLRRYVPADDLLRTLREASGDFNKLRYDDDLNSLPNEKLVALTQLLYDFPDPIHLPGKEPGPDELWTNNGNKAEEYYRIALWRQIADDVLNNRTFLKRMTLRAQAHQQEEYNDSVYDKHQHEAPLYVPLVLGYYYGSTFASLVSTQEQHKLATKKSQKQWWRVDPKAGLMHPALTLLKDLGPNDWDAAAKAVGIVKGPKLSDPDKDKDTSGDPPPERIPLDHIRRKNGLLVTDLQVHEQFLLQTFGFRAVEYGLYVKDKEGTEHLRHFISAMTDMCDGLNLSPKKLTEAGGLAIAFGSRGHGGKYAAFYQTGYRIINLTKTKGDGTVAHEWMHYLDHVLFMHLFGGGSTEPFASHHIQHLASAQNAIGAELEIDKNGRLASADAKKRSKSRAQEEKEREEKAKVKEETQASLTEIKWPGFGSTEIVQEAKVLLIRLWGAIRNGYYYNNAPGTTRDINSLVTAHENVTLGQASVMSGNRHTTRVTVPQIETKATFKARPNTSLGKSLQPLIANVKAGHMTLEQVYTEMRSPRLGYSSYFVTESTEPVTERFHGAWVFGSIANALGVESVDVTLSSPIVSTFYMEAAKTKNPGYWAAPWELYARSFERFITDELATKGQANNYLVNDRKFEYRGSMYPMGAEAEMINTCWREFFKFLTTKGGLGSFSAPWADGVRTDEYLVFGKTGAKTTADDVKDGSILPAAPVPADAPAAPAPTGASPDEAKAKKLKLAAARLRLAAAAAMALRL